MKKFLLGIATFIMMAVICVVYTETSTHFLSESMHVYAENLNSFTVGVNHSSGGVLEIVDENGNSVAMQRGEKVTVNQYDDLIIKAVPNNCFSVTSIKINDTEINPTNTIILNHIDEDCSIYVEFRLTDIDKLLDYGDYYLHASEYANMSALSENQILRAVCSYSDTDISGMVSREVYKKAFDIVWQSLLAQFTDKPDYEEEQVDKLTDTFIEFYYNELVKDDGFTQIVDLNDYAIPFEKVFKEVKSWSSISKDEMITLYGYWLFETSQMKENNPISINDALFQSKKELGNVYNNWDKYLNFFDSAYSFQEFVFQMVMLRQVDRQIVEDLYNITDESTVLHMGLHRRLERIDSSDVSLMVEYAIDEGLVSQLGELTQKMTFGILGTSGNAVGLIYSAISSGIEIVEKMYNVASVGDYVIACYACDVQSYFYQEIENFINAGNTDAKKLELLIRAHSSAAKTAVLKGENAISKLYNGNMTDEKLKEKEEIEYKFSFYKPWINSSACSYTTFINQWIEYAEARENGEPLNYSPPSTYTADVLATGNVVFDNHSFKVVGTPEVSYYSNVRLDFALGDDASLVISDNYVADVKISDIVLGTHTLYVDGNVIVESMTLDAGTLHFVNEPFIQGNLYAGENTNLVFNDGITIKGKLDTSKGNTTISGDVKHLGGVLSLDNSVINGNYYGYNEDEYGNKLPGGYILLDWNTDYLKITGDCYMYNSGYSGYSFNNPYIYNNLKSGTLELQGDFINLGDNRIGSSANVIFSGENVQKIVSSNKGEYHLRNVVVKSPGLDASKAGYINIQLNSDVVFYGNVFKGYISCKDSKETDVYHKVDFVESVVMDGSLYGISGLTVNGNLYLNGDISYFGGYSTNKSGGLLTVNGDFTHISGLITPGNGVINGNYYGYNEDEYGNKLPGGYILLDWNTDYLKITGDCYMYNSGYSGYSFNNPYIYNNLKSGTLELQGDFINLGDNRIGSSTGVIFSGDKIQQVISTNGGSFNLCNVTVTSQGVDFLNSNAEIEMDSENYYIRRNSKNDIVYVAPKSYKCPLSPIVSDFVFDLPENVYFDGNEKKVTVNPHAYITGMGEITVKYYNEQDNLIEAPTNVGRYTIRVDVTEGENYAAISDLVIGEFEVLKSGVVLENTVHIYTSTIIPPTYYEQGYTLHECINCAYNYKDNYVDKLILPAISDLALKSRNYNSITLSWSENGEASGYIIQQMKDNAWVNIANIKDSTVTSYQIKNLAANTSYKFRAVAYVTENDKTAYSSYTSALTISTAPAQTAGFAITGRGSDYLTISWTKNEGASGYVIQEQIDGVWTKVVAIKGNDTTLYKVEGLQPNSFHRYRMVAYKTDTNGTCYGKYTGSAPGYTAPAMVTGLAGFSTSATSIAISWNKVTSANGYVIDIYKDGKWSQLVKITDSDVNSYTVSELTEGVQYKFRIKSYATNGTLTIYSTYSSAVAVSTEAFGIENLRMTNRGTDFISVRWDKNEEATGYMVYIYDGSAWKCVKTLTNSSSVSHKITGLESGKAYKVTVKAYKMVNGTKYISDTATVSVSTL